MELAKRFSEAELEKIADEAFIYMCACPAQLAVELRRLRKLISYQRNCETTAQVGANVHQIIASAATEAHVLLESCLDQVLTIEGWDRETLTMPAGLRVIRDASMGSDSVEGTAGE